MCSMSSYMQQPSDHADFCVSYNHVAYRFEPKCVRLNEIACIINEKGISTLVGMCVRPRIDHSGYLQQSSR